MVWVLFLVGVLVDKEAVNNSELLVGRLAGQRQH